MNCLTGSVRRWMTLWQSPRGSNCWRLTIALTDRRDLQLERSVTTCSQGDGGTAWRASCRIVAISPRAT